MFARGGSGRGVARYDIIASLLHRQMPGHDMLAKEMGPFRAKSMRDASIATIDQLISGGFLMQELSQAGGFGL